MVRQHPILTTVTVLYLGVVGWFTLGPQPLDEGTDSVVWRLLAFFSRYAPTEWITYSLLEFWANVAMFVPIGLFFLLLFGRRRWWLAIVLGMLLTLGIELVQQYLPDRVSDPRDILANSVGVLIGVMVAMVVTWPAAVRRARQRRMETRAA